MTMTDPVADFLTRVRNAVRVRFEKVEAPLSKMRIAIAEVLKREGFIRGFDVSAEGPQGTIRVYLKYGPEGEDIINRIDRISKPGCRAYTGVDRMPRPLRGLGIYVLSTPRGVLSDRAARKENVGGEILCKVC